MADYDAGDITERERLAAERQKEIAARHASGVQNQLERNEDKFDYADAQNRKLADLQLKQLRRKNEVDRFEAARNLRNAAIGLLGSMGTAMNGSSTGNFLRMIEDRSDADNVNYWNQLQQNINAVNNAYEESVNQNNTARYDTAINAEKAIRDIEDDLAANLNNINPNLYEAPATGDNIFYATEMFNEHKPQMNDPLLSGYIMPDNSVQNVRNMTPRNKVRRNDYFGNLMNRFNGR